jgi:penicillin-binding protein 1A
MREALRGQADRARPLPPGLVTVRISPRTGTVAGPNESDAIYETFMDGHLPLAVNGGVANPGQTPQNPGASSEPLF